MLGRSVAERVVAEAIGRLEVEHVAIPLIDWDALWHAGDDAPTDELVVGRVTSAAAVLADQLLALLPESPRPFVARMLNLDTSEHAHPAEPSNVRIFTWLRNVGAILVLFVVWQLWGTSLTEHHAQADLALQFAKSAKSLPDAVATKLQASSPARPAAAGRATAASPRKSSESSSGPMSSGGKVAPRSAASASALAQGAATLACSFAEGAAPQPQLVADDALAVPPDGALVGRIQIPAIGLSQYVVEGTDASDLSLGPGHYAGTPLLGEVGNVGIAGHRTTYGAPFDHLDEVKPCDDVYLTSPTGEQYRYVVTKAPFAVLPTDVAVLDQTTYNELTLTTCTPKFSATERLVVVARLAGPAPTAGAAPSATVGAAASSGSASSAATATTLAPTTAVSLPAQRATTLTSPTAAELSDDTSTWHLAELLVVAVIAILLIGLGLVRRTAVRFFGRWMAWAVLAPLWVFGLYFLFVALDSFLPANL